MLSQFPTIYDDELLYSILTRYHIMSGNTEVKTTLKELVGKKKVKVSPDLPTDLSYLWQVTCHFNIWKNTKQLVKKHTFFNYYHAFNKSKGKKVINYLTNTKEYQNIHTSFGQVANSIKDHKNLQLCPDCLKEDLEQKGEAFWRLSFQLPSVKICLKHSKSLYSSSVLFRNKDFEFSQLPSLNDIYYLDVKEYSGTEKIHLKYLAEESLKLLSGKYSFEIGTIALIYKKLLFLHGYISPKGFVYQEKLAKDFIDFYGEEFLEQLQSKIEPYKQTCWLKTITRKHRKAFHPLRHMLLINFFGETVNSVYKMNELNSTPFGLPPYPCLNPASNHYKEYKINNVYVTRCSKTGNPIGTFSCNCGFEYCRKGPDQEKEDKFRIGRVKKYGDVWINEVRRKIYKDRISYRQCARDFNVDTNTVIKYASEKIRCSKNNDLSQIRDLSITKKSEWLQLISKHPLKTKTELRKLNPALYIWLYRHEKNWFFKNSTTVKKSRKSVVRVEWGHRDEVMSKEVPTIITQLKKDTPPIRITKRRIGIALGNLSLIEKKLDYLPSLKRKIEENSENIRDFHYRKITWAIDEMIKSGEPLRVWKVRRVAGIKNMDEELRHYIFNEIKELI
ncbi:transposase [Halalkalibacillus sediminis]|uniref:Transposase n=1 Tax=Halalkalibacillus sediminis TaxID=2018042 RepID=A0A2I0QTB3_9BACI|nr:TnsD family Tn7-like transposition protein [Halalkalibacillus sediminis]PKR77566.1 transposase [Halalkalibacillus sediminis]